MLNPSNSLILYIHRDCILPFVESKISGLAGMTLKKKTLLLAVFSTVSMVVFLLISNQRQMQNVSQRILAQVSQNIDPVIIATSRSDTKDGYVFESKWTYEYTSTLCKGASTPLMSEDLLCKVSCIF